MRKMVVGMIVVAGMMALIAVVFGQTTLTVVRHSDNTIWKMTCEGTSNCSVWTQIGGALSAAPTLTWDPEIQKYILIGIGNDGSSIFRSTFEADGTWNNDWVMIGSGATGSPSPVAVTVGGFNKLNPQQIALLRWYGVNTVGNHFPVCSISLGIAFDGANIWVANYFSNTVTKLRASDGANLGYFPVGSAPVGIAFDGANIWVANTGGTNVTILRASDGGYVGTFYVGIYPWAVAFDGANIWVTDTGSLSVFKF